MIFEHEGIKYLVTILKENEIFSAQYGGEEGMAALSITSNEGIPLELAFNIGKDNIQIFKEKIFFEKNFHKFSRIYMVKYLWHYSSWGPYFGRNESTVEIEYWDGGFKKLLQPCGGHFSIINIKPCSSHMGYIINTLQYFRIKTWINKQQNKIETNINDNRLKAFLGCCQLKNNLLFHGIVKYINY
jgi:hypothetical protein